VTFRLYPTKSQEAKLHYWRRLHKDLFNACLAERKTAYQREGRAIGYFDQQNALPKFKEYWEDYKELGSQALQATVKRVDFAFMRFFQRLGKYPRFKSSRYYRGWTYPGVAGWKAHSNGDNGHLEISNLGKIQRRGKARSWGTPTTCTIVWKNNKWYASISVKCEVQRQTGTGAVGIDIGTLTAVAFDNGKKIDNPRFLANAQTDIRKASRELRRKRKPTKGKTKASRRWKKARKRVSKLQKKVASRRQDWTHKVAAQIIRDNSLVATETLNVKNMTAQAKKGDAGARTQFPGKEAHPKGKRKRQKSGLNRSILDVGFGMLRSAIKYKVEEAGGFFIEVPAQKVKPSQTCPKCLAQKKKELSERIHCCEKCGYTADRDVASALVCLNYAKGLGTSLLDVDDSSSTVKTRKHTGSLQQLGQKKRQKPPTQRSGVRG
jgi:putative transposase